MSIRMPVFVAVVVGTPLRPWYRPPVKSDGRVPGASGGAALAGRTKASCTASATPVRSGGREDRRVRFITRSEPVDRRELRPPVVRLGIERGLDRHGVIEPELDLARPRPQAHSRAREREA